MRVPTHIEGPQGRGKKVELGFLEPGKTTRVEVQQRLGWISTGATDPQLFLGRWVGSSWAVLVVGAGGGGGASRLWKTHNLVAEFDTEGRLVRSRVMSDKELLPALREWAKARNQPLDLAQPIRLTVGHRHGWSGRYQPAELFLGADSVEFRERVEGKGKSHDFRVARDQLKRLTYAGKSEGASGVQNIRYRLHLRQKTRAGRKLNLQLDVPRLLTLIRYMQTPAPR